MRFALLEPRPMQTGVGRLVKLKSGPRPPQYEGGWWASLATLEAATDEEGRKKARDTGLASQTNVDGNICTTGSNDQRSRTQIREAGTRAGCDTTRSATEEDRLRGAQEVGDVLDGSTIGDLVVLDRPVTPVVDSSVEPSQHLTSQWVKTLFIYSQTHRRTQREWRRIPQACWPKTQCSEVPKIIQFRYMSHADGQHNVDHDSDYHDEDFGAVDSSESPRPEDSARTRRDRWTPKIGQVRHVTS